MAAVPSCSVEQADEAIARAAAAQAAWRAVAPGDRAALLRRFAEVVDTHLEELAQLEVACSGHPVGQARWEAGNVRDVLRYYFRRPGTPHRPADPGARRPGRHVQGAGRIVGLIVRGTSPCRSWAGAWHPPWPPGTGDRQAGGTDPAHRDPDRRAGPGGRAARGRVPGCCPGRDPWLGQRLVDHEAVRKIVFTGSTEVGSHIMAGCAQQVKRLTLELGGKSANIVFADADLERAAATAPYAVFDNAGQDCCARSRILVQRSVFDRFMELLEPAVKGVAVGDPREPATEMGPLISAEHRARVASYVPDQAPVAFRGSAPAGPGFWFPPTVLAPVAADDPAFTEEVFGPVVAVVPVEDEAEVHRRRESHAVRAVRIHLDREPRARAAGRPGGGDRATCRSTRTPRSATGPRSAGSSSPAWAASSGRTRWTRSPRSRTCSSRRTSEHRDEERTGHVHAAPAGPNRRDHRCGQRHRAGQHAPAGCRGSHRGRRRRG